MDAVVVVVAVDEDEPEVEPVFEASVVDAVVVSVAVVVDAAVVVVTAGAVVALDEEPVDVVVEPHAASASAAADRINRKKVDGHTARPSRKANGRPRSTPYNPPSDPWWKKERSVPMPASTGTSRCRRCSKMRNDGTLRNCRLCSSTGTYSSSSTTR